MGPVILPIGASGKKVSKRLLLQVMFKLRYAEFVGNVKAALYHYLAYGEGIAIAVNSYRIQNEGRVCLAVVKQYHTATELAHTSLKATIKACVTAVKGAPETRCLSLVVTRESGKKNNDDC